jgi:hypothetical protein
MSTTPSKVIIPKDKIETLSAALDVMENKRNRLQKCITVISDHQAKTKDLYREYYLAAADLHDTSTLYKDDPVMWNLLKHFNLVDDSCIKYKYSPENDKKRKL